MPFLAVLGETYRLNYAINEFLHFSTEINCCHRSIVINETFPAALAFVLFIQIG
jgi:hypothetical protein